jgi:pyridoxamine 5'-phosphate oxidase
MAGVSTDAFAHLAAMRREYAAAGLSEADLAADWLGQLRAWLRAAVEVGLPEANAMVVATADAQGRPSARTVLLKGLDERGLVFFTNYRSRKGQEAQANPYDSAVFPWHPMDRQLVVVGAVERVDRAESEAYFATRPRIAQLGAWASPQSQVLADRADLDERYAQAQRRFPDLVPVPEHWGGLRLVPSTVEFWQGREGRLHDRLRYRRTDGDEWVVERLAP